MSQPKKNLQSLVFMGLLVMGACKPEVQNIKASSTDRVNAESPKKTLSNGNAGYWQLKQRCKTGTKVFFQDFDQSNSKTQLSADQWRIGETTWIFPTSNGTSGPVFIDSSLVLTSSKAPGTTSKRNEIQSLQNFPNTPMGEIIIGARQARWAMGYENNADYWADTSVGLEFYYPGSHQAIVSCFGNLGVFKDPTGYCPTGTCMYAGVSGWSSLVSPSSPFIGIRITWVTETYSGKKTFRLFVNNETSARATITDVDYAFSDFKIRLNANVTEPDKLPATDSESLYIDYVCLKNDISNF